MAVHLWQTFGGSEERPEIGVELLSHVHIACLVECALHHCGVVVFLREHGHEDAVECAERRKVCSHRRVFSAVIYLAHVDRRIVGRCHGLGRALSVEDAVHVGSVLVGEGLCGVDLLLAETLDGISREEGVKQAEEAELGRSREHDERDGGVLRAAEAVSRND